MHKTLFGTRVDVIGDLTPYGVEQKPDRGFKGSGVCIDCGRVVRFKGKFKPNDEWIITRNNLGRIIIRRNVWSVS